MRRLTAILVVSLILATSLLAGCRAGQEKPKDPATEQQGQVNSGDLRTVYPVTIVDDLGQEVTISAKPQRIVSLLPSSTEILCALGQQPIAVTKWDDYPADVQQKAEYIFEDSLKPNLEQILKLEPDLILYSLASKEDINKIKALGIPVAAFEAQSISAVYKNIELIGRITDSGEQAAHIIGQMQAKERSIEERITKLSADQKRKVWMEVDSLLFTAGKGTFLHEVITKAGGINIAEDIQGWGQFNSEQVIARNPDVILETYSYTDPAVIEKIKKRQGWNKIEAVINDKVMSLDNSMISRQGPRIIDGLEITARAIYPELFKED